MDEKVYNGRETDNLLVYKISDNEYVTPGPLPGVLMEPNKTICVARTETEVLAFVSDIWKQHHIRCTIIVERDDQGLFCKPDEARRINESQIDY
jgi:hypothetical protein